MVAGKNSVPLEKVLLPMDLSKGLDERTRPEVGGDQSKLITTLENLVQDELGAWVKRPAITPAGVMPTPDQADIVRIGRSNDGYCAVGNDGKLYHYNGDGSFNRKSHVPELRVTGRTIASVQVSPQYRVHACASNDRYEVVVTDGSWSSTGNRTVLMTIYDRNSGQSIGTYDLGSLCSATGSFTPQVKIVFVGDLLHIYAWNGDDTLGGPLVFLQYLIGSGIPIGATTIAGLNTSPITDINRWATASNQGSVITYGGTALSIDTSGVQTTRAFTSTAYSVDVFNDAFMFLSRDSATGRVEFTAVSTANINGAAIFNWIDPSLGFVGLEVPGIGFDGVNTLYLVVEDTLSGFPRIRSWTTDITTPNFTLRSTILGWRLNSTPFRVKDLGAYVHLNKDESGLTSQNPVGCHVLVDLERRGTVNYSASTNTSDYLNVAAVLDPYVAVRNTAQATFAPGSPVATTYWQRHRYFQWSSNYPEHVNVCIPVQTTARSAGLLSLTITDDSPEAYSFHNFGPNVHIAGGALTVYDGGTPAEVGFFDYPQFTAADSGVAGNVNGSVNYVAIYRRVDSRGAVHYSRVFGPVSLTVASKKVTITALPCHVTNSETGSSGDARVTIELYRTVSGGTQYHLCSTSEVPATGPQNLIKGATFFSATDDLSDAALQSQPLLYRQPGSAGTALDRYPGPSGDVACQHKDRSWVVSADGERVYYSSFYVDGEGAWFNPQFNVQAHGGTGPVTALASMDGRLFIFKRDAVFVVDGDGPPENGGTGSEFSPPARLLTEYGCTDKRSLVETPDGLMYRSDRGIEILTRSLQVKWIGERVQDTVNSHRHTKYALLDASGRVRIGLAERNAITQKEGLSECVGKEIVYDTTADCWSVAKYWFDSTYGRIAQTACNYDDVYFSGNRQVAMADGSFSYVLDHDQHADSGSYVPWTFETGWIRPNGIQARFRFHDALFLGRRHKPHKLTMSLAYDFEDYSQSRMWEGPSVARPLEELNIQPKETQPVMFRLKITDTAPTGFGADADNQSIDLLGVCFVVSPKAGAQQVAEFRKG